jgi:cytochrome c553
MITIKQASRRFLNGIGRMKFFGIRAIRAIRGGTGFVLLCFGFLALAGEDEMESARQKAAMLCAACHGAEGNSAAFSTPILAGQLADVLHKELKGFRRVDEKPAARNNDVMNAVSTALTDEDRRILSIYFSRQKWKPSTLSKAGEIEKLVRSETSERLKADRRLWLRGDFDRRIPACAGCHGPSGKGLPSQYPRLAGQHSEYTAAQLNAYRSGARANDREKVMRTIAERLSDPEIDALSDFIAGLR